MGLRYRKSINLGGGFRINLSKSGVGYSFGVKGYRITKTAKRTTRTTASIPVTGISYVSETGKRKKLKNSIPNEHTNASANPLQTYDTMSFENASASQLYSDGLEELIALANNSMKKRSLTSVIFFVSLILGLVISPFLVITIISFIYGIYIYTKGTVELDYYIDDEMMTEISERMAPLVKISKSKKIWRETQSSKVANKKYQAGANAVIKREKCTASCKVPFPFKTNVEAVSFQSGKETLIFLPDKLFVIQNGKIGALSYSDVTTSVRGQRFIETEAVPKDAKVVDYTWQYVNKDGNPDMRFKNKNKKIPVCLYGEMSINAEQGLNTIIMFSNLNIE